MRALAALGGNAFLSARRDVPARHPRRRERGDGFAVIGALADAGAMLRGEAGTLVTAAREPASVPVPPELAAARS